MAIFIYTMQSPFYEHMMGSVSSNFVDIVIIGERIEFRLKNGKIAQGLLVVANIMKPMFNSGRKREGEVQAASAIPYWVGHPSTRYRPGHSHPSTQYPHPANTMSCTNKIFLNPDLHHDPYPCLIMFTNLDKVGKMKGDLILIKLRARV